MPVFVSKIGWRKRRESVTKLRLREAGGAKHRQGSEANLNCRDGRSSLVDQLVFIWLNRSSLVVEGIDPLNMRELVANLDNDSQLIVQHIMQRIMTR